MSVRNSARRLAAFVTAAGLTLALLMPAGPAFADAGFRQWVAGFRATAVSGGVSGAVYDRAMRGIEPDPVVLEKARTQPEFTAPAW
ncbi:MAG: lytic murein transglycosylase, partial [Mesorhizobium sp.]